MKNNSIAFEVDADQPMAHSETSNPQLLSDDAQHWAFINRWRVEPQADDRRVENGTVSVMSGSPSASRASARQSHQWNYKKWAQSRATDGD